MDSADAADQLSYGWSVALGLIQGLTEFLPVSSSGHLALAQHLGMDQPLPVAFDILLHVATVLVVLAAFGKDLLHCWRERRIVLVYIAVGTLPVVFIGLLFKDWVEGLREYPLAVCGSLLITSGVLALMSRVEKTSMTLEDTGASSPILIGLAQATALLPGVSRSGSTIAAGVLLGLERDEAVRFSFLLMIPAVLGAATLKGLQIIKDPALLEGLQFGPCLAGFIAAGISGWIAIRLVIGAVRAQRMIWFSRYCALIAIAGIVYFTLFAS